MARIHRAALALCVVFVPATQAQTDTVTLTVGAPPRPSVVSASVIGPRGTQTYYYYVVARYPVGNSVAAGPALVTGVPDTLSVTNYVQVSWAIAPGAVAYDVLRQTTPVFLSICTNCLAASATTSTSANDTTNSIAGYTLILAPAATGYLSINNRDRTVPVLTFTTPLGLEGVPVGSWFDWYSPAVLTGRYRSTGVFDASFSALSENYASGSATPTAYVRLGGILGNFAAGVRTDFGLFSDNVIMRFRTLGNYAHVWDVDSIEQARLTNTALTLRNTLVVGTAGGGTINLPGATSGAIDILPPAVAGSNTFTLPALTGTAIVSTQPYGIVMGIGASNLGAPNGTYYFGIPSLAMNATVQLNAMGSRSACTIKWVYLRLRHSAVANATATVSIRLNNTTDTNICTALDMSSVTSTCQATGLSIALNGTTDYFEGKFVTGATLPTNVTIWGNVYCE